MQVSSTAERMADNREIRVRFSYLRPTYEDVPLGEWGVNDLAASQQRPLTGYGKVWSIRQFWKLENLSSNLSTLTNNGEACAKGGDGHLQCP